MKKLIVTETDKVEPLIASQVQEFLSIQASYGLYDFNTDRIIEDVCSHFKLKRTGGTYPEIYLSDAAGGTMTILFKEEYLGY